MVFLFRNNDVFATHQIFLKHYIEQTKGDIIEFGTGYGSTPLIMEMIKNTKRKLISIENNLNWLNKMKEIYPENKQHIYYYVTDWEKDIIQIERNFKNDFSICFIDSSPWESRILAMNYFKDRVDYVIIHDVDYYPNNGIFGKLKEDGTYDFSDICGDTSNWKLYKPYTSGPPTLVFTTKNKHIQSVIW